MSKEFGIRFGSPILDTGARIIIAPNTEEIPVYSQNTHSGSRDYELWNPPSMPVSQGPLQLVNDYFINSTDDGIVRGSFPIYNLFIFGGIRQPNGIISRPFAGAQVTFPGFNGYNNVNIGATITRPINRESEWTRVPDFVREGGRKKTKKSRKLRKSKKSIK